MAKLYQSESWLRRKVVIERKTPEEIAKMCGGVSLMTIYRYMNRFGLKVNK